MSVVAAQMTMVMAWPKPKALREIRTFDAMQETEPLGFLLKNNLRREQEGNSDILAL